MNQNGSVAPTLCSDQSRYIQNKVRKDFLVFFGDKKYMSEENLEQSDLFFRYQGNVTFSLCLLYDLKLLLQTYFVIWVGFGPNLTVTNMQKSYTLGGKYHGNYDFVHCRWAARQT